MKGARVLIVGVAYKPDVGDTRETPAAKLMQLLMAEGALVSYHDPFVPEFALGGALGGEGEVLRSVELSARELSGCDCVVIVTDHSDVDYALIAGSGVLVLDTRNALASAGERGSLSSLG